MWGVIEDNKDVFAQYLARKKQLLGLEKLTYDVDAPLGKVSKTYSFDEAANFVVQQLAKVSPRMAEFVVSAFEKRWVEAEDRGFKRAGAFCTSFPVSKETRVFTTFAGTPGNVSTLAHELGHSFHQHVMTDLPLLAQRYAMNVAETASTFNELVVADASVLSAATQEEKISLLGEKVERSIAMFMNIHARFIFETNFYEERRRGPVGAGRLNELMLEAQKQAYRDSLDVWHPRFWCSKLHFYNTGVPFYNFPYTFGFLFSSGIYALFKQGVADFEQRTSICPGYQHEGRGAGCAPGCGPDPAGFLAAGRGHGGGRRQGVSTAHRITAGAFLSVPTSRAGLDDLRPACPQDYCQGGIACSTCEVVMGNISVLCSGVSPRDMNWWWPCVKPHWITAELTGTW